jgi:transcriptional regulator with PAS, ATPase and Fis domain
MVDTTKANTSALPELASFLDTLNEPHILCDREYRVVLANTAYRTRYGWRDDVVGHRCYELSHHYKQPCDQAGESCPLGRSLQSRQRERGVHLHHTSAGEVYESIELSPILDASGEIAYFIEKLEPLPVARGLAHAQGLIGRAPSFRRMLELVSRVARSEAAVLLQGESGTGKELVAQAIHDASRRAGCPFVAVDCSGLSENLFESELFGHERGAFTGATGRRIGLVEAASGGTLFLDELGDIPLTMQVKLLRLLETGAYRRVGATELQTADIRLVSATHRPLKALVDAQRFRHDLYYRLNTFPITLPALSERREDIPLLAAALLSRVAPKRELGISQAALNLLQSYPYPGNVRELRNLLERASLLCDGDLLQPEHLAEEARIVPASTTYDTQDNAEASFAASVAAHRGSRQSLAKKLGISERSLYRRLGKIG